ncbi:MAG TPA: hypothetical protein PLC79_00505, partial [Phycisphaerae bacterium]|nr:hypothetical protein [Phycisphaerae bacterium]
RRVHKKGDRKEYFTSETDVWEMFQTIARERKRREVEPIIETIRRCRDMVGREMAGLKGADAVAARVYVERLDAMQEFLEALVGLLNLMLRGSRADMYALTKMMAQLVSPGS